MADQLTDDQISEFKEAFSLFDKDGDERATMISVEKWKRYLDEIMVLDERLKNGLEALLMKNQYMENIVEESLL